MYITCIIGIKWFILHVYRYMYIYTLVFSIILPLFTGIIGIIWFIFWLLLGFDSPATHPRISQSEREYIETSISAAKLEENENKVRM